MNKNKIKLAVASAAAALGIVVAQAVPASAATSGYCWPSGLSSNNRLSVSEWIVYGSTGIAYRRYHLDENAVAPWKNYAIWVGSVKMSGTNDVYYTTYNVNHTIKAEWREYGADVYWSATCSVYM